MNEREEAGHAQVQNEISQLLHDFKNQLSGLKLYAALLKKILQRETLNVNEGIEICDKLIETIDVLTMRTKEVGRTNQVPMGHKQ